MVGEAEDYALWFFWGNASQDAFAANITFLEGSLWLYNKTSHMSISRFLIKVCVWIKIFVIVIYSFKNYIIFEAPPTGQPKNYAMEKGVPRLKCLKNGLRNC